MCTATEARSHGQAPPAGGANHHSTAAPIATLTTLARRKSPRRSATPLAIAFQLACRTAAVRTANTSIDSLPLGRLRQALGACLPKDVARSLAGRVVP